MWPSIIVPTPSSCVQERPRHHIKKLWGPFCCWVTMRRKRRKQNNFKKRPYFPLEGNNQNNYQLFGIPIHSPTEYYLFLEKYFNWGQQQNEIERRELERNKMSKKSFIDGSSNSSSFNENWDCCTCPGKPSTSTDYQPSICGQLTVSIRKKFGQPLGLGIAGGSDRPMPPTISYLKPGFVAQRCDQIQVGDRLLEVNGIKVNRGLTHSKVLSLLRGNNLLELKLEYDLNEQQREELLLNRKEGIITKATEIELRDQMSSDGDFGLFGIVIRGGAFGPDLNKNKPITITSIRVGGPAHRDGRIRPGDRIVAINGISVNDSTLSDAINLIKTSPQSKVNLTVEYDTCNLASLRKVPNSLRVEIEKTPGVDFGIELAIKQVPIWPTGSRRAVIVEGLVPASIAERCGAIQPNDELMSIDLISLKLISSLNEVYQLLNSHSSLIRLELLPAEMRGKINLQNGECQK